MWKLRLLAAIARRLGFPLTYASRFFDDKSQARGRTLWSTDDVGEAIDQFEAFHRLTREKTHGICYLTIEAQIDSVTYKPASRTQPGDPGHDIDDDQLPLPIREPVQDGTEVGPDGTGTKEVEAPETEGAAGGGAESGLGAGAEAPTPSDGPVEGVKIDLSDLGVR